MAGTDEALGSSSGSYGEEIARLDCDPWQKHFEKTGKVSECRAGTGSVSCAPFQKRKVICRHHVRDAIKSSPWLRRSYKRLKDRARVSVFTGPW